MIRAIVTVYDDDKKLYKSLVEPCDDSYDAELMVHKYLFKFVFAEQIKERKNESR